MKILILNGSVHGATGNSALLIKKLQKMHKEIEWDVVHLNKTSHSKKLVNRIEKADALLFLTGTYWDSWGSPLQKFLENITHLEGDPSIVGKAAGACVLMHSVGGKEVLSRLQGVLSSMGFLIPPMSGIAHSLSGQLALQRSSKHADDFWSLDDMDVVIENLKVAAHGKSKWATWPVDRKNFRKNWL